MSISALLLESLQYTKIHSDIEPKTLNFLYHYATTGSLDYACLKTGVEYEEGKALLLHPDIKEALRILYSNNAMQKEEVIGRLTNLARGDFSDFITVDDKGNITFDYKKALERGQTALIKKIAFSKDGRLTVELHDQQVALNSLAKALDIYSDIGPIENVIKVIGGIDLDTDI